MKRLVLRDMSADQLVHQFALLAVAQDAKLLENDIAVVNRLFRKIAEIETELKRRFGDQRMKLMVLYEHPNMQVRLKAAGATLAVAPQAARKQLEEIVASKWQPYAGDAGMTITNLDSGFYKPK
jgi:hypothetical protein